ncbi:hypothetical protein [Streptomyces sp. Tu 4128]|uniref:hypothetical protein n=1 Tax=Streptomyces sp. Tu 4128 TaxID=1120314 RepID=UPI001F11A358|nr:hypothetical protein [Streptomyces sp. Tu 4128]
MTKDLLWEDSDPLWPARYTASGFVIAMPASIEDVDAITYAARFYAAIADGRSVHTAHRLSRVAVEMNGLANHDLPTLNYAADIDPRATKLVTPPPV